jgi:hypothetical protein
VGLQLCRAAALAKFDAPVDDGAVIGLVLLRIVWLEEICFAYI